MIQPIQQGDEFLADVRQSATSGADELRVWWLGQSGFLLQWHGNHVLFDPYLSDSLTRKYADTDKPHERMTARVVAPEQLGFVDLVTSSHNHTDHLDADTLLPLAAVNPALTIVVAAANQTFAADRLNVAPERLVAIDAGEQYRWGDCCLHAVPAAHEAVDRDQQGRCRYVGYVMTCGRWTVYHSGDTMLYDGMVEGLKRWNIDLAILPINGRAPERRVAGNLWGREAATLAHEIGAQQVVPCHYEGFRFNTETPDEFVATCQALKQPFAVLRAGEKLVLASASQPDSVANGTLPP